MSEGETDFPILPYIFIFVVARVGKEEDGMRVGAHVSAHGSRLYAGHFGEESCETV